MRLASPISLLFGAGCTSASTILGRLDGSAAGSAAKYLAVENSPASPPVFVNAAGSAPAFSGNSCNVNGAIVPKVFIISMFKPEGDIWYANGFTEGSIGNLLAKNITVPGLSLLYPQAHCLKDCSVCQLTTGESEINAASTITALMLSTQFNLQKTYFLIAGIAGINPKQGTIADVAFSKYAVQVALQYEFDARDIPNNFSTGYVPQGAQHHSQYPQAIYGTEVFEVNEALRDMAAGFAGSAKLVDTEISKEYRSRYKGPSPNVYEKATRNPGIIKCDVATSDVYFSGTHLGEAFDNTTRLFTNGSGIPCMTAQEDNATLEAMIRFAKLKVMDFARIIIMRSAADFDRPYPGLPCIDNLFYTNQGAFLSSIANLYLAGTPVVKGILEGWKSKFEAGITPLNYIGDIFGTLGGAPDFGPGPQFRQKNPVTSFEKRSSDVEELSRRSAYRRHEMKGMEGAEIARIANGNA